MAQKWTFSNKKNRGRYGGVGGFQRAWKLKNFLWKKLLKLRCWGTLLLLFFTILALFAIIFHLPTLLAINCGRLYKGHTRESISCPKITFLWHFRWQCWPNNAKLEVDTSYEEEHFEKTRSKGGGCLKIGGKFWENMEKIGWWVYFYELFKNLPYLGGPPISAQQVNILKLTCIKRQYEIQLTLDNWYPG